MQKHKNEYNVDDFIKRKLLLFSSLVEDKVLQLEKEFSTYFSFRTINNLRCNQLSIFIDEYGNLKPCGGVFCRKRTTITNLLEDNRNSKEIRNYLIQSRKKLELSEYSSSKCIPNCK